MQPISALKDEHTAARTRRKWGERRGGKPFLAVLRTVEFSNDPSEPITWKKPPHARNGDGVRWISCPSRFGDDPAVILRKYAKRRQTTMAAKILFYSIEALAGNLLGS